MSTYVSAPMTDGPVLVGTVVGTVVGQPTVVNGLDMTIQNKVHDKTRNGRLDVVTSDEAWAYMDSLPIENKTPNKYSGYKTCRPIGLCCSCCRGVGIGGAYFMVSSRARLCPVDLCFRSFLLSRPGM